MSRGGPRPGDGVVARGKIRVDARRAVEKLREHLLVDLHLYTLEIVRAAVAGGATWIDLEHDADDVAIAFDGESLDEGTMTRLLDHVLVEAVSSEARRLRLLATGVNAALGLSPSYVDIFTPAPQDAEAGAPSSQGKGRSCLRVRWTPALLAPKDKDEAAKAPLCERVPAPEGMPERGVRIEVRRRIGWNVVKRALARQIPREVELLGGATHEVRVPVTLARKPFPRTRRPAALIRAPIEVRGSSRAAVEIVAPFAGYPEIEFLEHGVCLTRYAWSFGAHFPSEPLGKVALPVRVVVDAEELPTNASRSEIRQDAPLLGLVNQAAPSAFDDAVQALVAAVTGRGEAAPGTEILTEDKEQLEDALGALVCVVAAAARKGAPLSEGARALLDVPLLSDGIGRPLAPALLFDGEAPVVHIWAGEEPLSEDLTPWVQGVVWQRGRAVEGIFELFTTADAEQLIKLAKTGAERRRALLAHAPSLPVVPRLEDELLRHAFAEEEGDFAGLRGEVVVVAESAERPGTVVRAFVEGRHLDTINLDAETIPLRLEIALGWEGRIRPDLTYDAIVQDQAFRLAVWYATNAAVLAADREAARLGEKPPAIAAALRGALRAAIATHIIAAKRIRLANPPEDLPLSSLRGLHGALIWPMAEGDRWGSLRGIEASLAKSGVICVAKPGPPRSAVDGRPVLVVKDRELEWLAEALAPRPAFIQYGQWLLTPRELADREATRASAVRGALSQRLEQARAWPAMDFTRPGMVGLIAPAPAAMLLPLHAGKRLPEVSFKPSLGRVAAAVDDDAILPNDPSTGGRSSAALDVMPGVERQLCEAIVAALEGDLVSRGLLGHGSPESALELRHELRVYLLESAAALQEAFFARGRAEDKALLTRVEALPFMTELDESGAPVAVSLAGILRAHPAPARIPCLAAPPSFETLDWRPVIVGSAGPLSEALERWAGGGLSRGEDEIPSRMMRAVAMGQRRVILMKPAADPSTVEDLADPGAKVIFLGSGASGIPNGVTVAAALPNTHVVPPPGSRGLSAIPGAELAHAWIDVLYQGRKICRRRLDDLAMPIVARINLSDESFLSEWRDLSPTGVILATVSVRAAAFALASELIKGAHGPSRSAALLGDLRALRLIDAVVRASLVEPPWSDAAAIPALIRSDDLLWPTVQGEWLPLSAMRTVPTNGAGVELYSGSAVHVPWYGPTRGKADLDAPVFHMPETPESAVLQSIFKGLGIQCRSVTAVIAKLQARRSSARPGEAPTLAGLPTHPDLRMTLADAGVQSAEGELEIIEGPASDVRIIGLDGAALTLTEGLPFPLRVVARVESVDVGADRAKTLSKDIAKAAARRLMSMHRKLDELPLFVRDHLRRLLCKVIGSRSKTSARQMKAPIFLDIDGAWRALADCCPEPGADLLYTTDPPPYPQRRPSGPILRLTAAEASTLGALGKLKDVTSLMRRDLSGETRASAPQASAVNLDLETRAKCLLVITVDEEGVSGEVGVLAPQHQDKRGINVFVTRRPLCLIDDGPGWALCAAVNDDSIKPNRWFDGVKSHGDAQELQRVVRAIAERSIRASLAAPEGALAVRWIDSAGDEKAPAIVGALWLPAVWPLDPHLRVLRELGRAPTIQPVIAPGSALLLKRHVPVCGNLMAAPDVPWATIERVALRETELMLEELAKTNQGGPNVEAYLWNMGLIGIASVRVPPARTAEGLLVGIADVVGELARRGCVWVSRRAGWSEGAFPSAPPSFILLDDGPLVHVLRHRAPPSAVRELGGEIGPAASHLPHAAPQAARVHVDPSVEAGDLGTAPASGLFDIAASGSALDPSAALTGSSALASSAAMQEVPWLERLRQRVALLFNASPPPIPEPNALCAALHEALGELGLVGGPVFRIIEAKSGPAIRYDKRNRWITLNRRHRSLLWLRSSEAPSARALCVLLAAIVSEVNRALGEVTDAEERRVLLQLLRAGPDAS